MKEDRQDCYLDADQWGRLFQCQPTLDEKREWWERALVGETEWSVFLGKVVGAKPLSRRGLQKLLDQHIEGEHFVGGRVFSTSCNVLISYKYRTDKRRRRPVPIFFNAERLGAEWLEYQKTKRGIRRSAAMKRHHGVVVELPGAPTESSILHRLGHSSEKFEIKIRPRYENPIVDQRGGFDLQGQRFATFAEALERAVDLLVSALLRSDEPRIKFDRLNEIDDFARHARAGAYYVALLDRAVSIRRVVPRQY